MSNLVLSSLATEINREHQAIEQALSSAVDHAIKAGELLTQAKASLPHGAWGVWLEENCTVSTRTANNYMRVARELPLLDDSNRQRVANLPLRDALSALAEPRQSQAKLPAPAPEPELSLNDNIMQPGFDQVLMVSCQKGCEQLTGIIHPSYISWVFRLPRVSNIWQSQ